MFYLFPLSDGYTGPFLLWHFLCGLCRTESQSSWNSIEVYYDHRHFQNVKHLIVNTIKTLDYCQLNFGRYPYKTIRFAEVSSFTQGFAGTAYPATIFMTGDIILHDSPCTQS